MTQGLPGNFPTLSGVVQRKQPAAGYADGVPTAPLRLDANGNVFPLARAPTRHGLADEGSYVISTSNRFFGVGVGVPWNAANVAPNFSAPTTQPQLVIVNNSPAVKTPMSAYPSSVYLDYLKLICTTVASGASALRWCARLDGAPVVQGNNSFLPIDANAMGGGVPLGSVQILSQQLVPTSVVTSASGYVVGNGSLGGLNAVGTELFIAFGSTDVGCFSGSIDNQPGKRADSGAPIIIPPGGALYFYFWAPGSSAGFTPEIEIGAWVR